MGNGLKRFIQPAFCISSIVLGTVLATGVAHAEISASVQSSNSDTTISLDQSTQSAVVQNGITLASESSGTGISKATKTEDHAGLTAKSDTIAAPPKSEVVSNISDKPVSATDKTVETITAPAEIKALSGIAITAQPQSMSNLGAATHVVMRELSNDFGLMAPTLPVSVPVQTQAEPLSQQPAPTPAPAEPTHTAMDLLQKIGTYFVVKPIASSVLSMVHAMADVSDLVQLALIHAQSSLPSHTPLSVAVSLFLMLLAAAGFGMAARGSSLSFATLPVMSSPQPYGRVSSFYSVHPSRIIRDAGGYNSGTGLSIDRGAGWVRNKSLNTNQRLTRKGVTE
jgi:hypothetical protein